MTSARVVSDLMLPLWEEVLLMRPLLQCASAHNPHGELLFIGSEEADGRAKKRGLQLSHRGWLSSRRVDGRK